jgi:hypothetical protein
MQVVIRWAVAVLVGTLAVGCAAGPTPTPIAAQPGHAEAGQGRFRLTFDLPTTSWSAREPIQGTASLEVLGNTGADIGGSGTGLFGFGFVEVGGRRHLEPGFTADCRAYRLEVGHPTVSPIVKSGGFASDDPDAAFYRAFFQDPLVHLPTGQWQIVAVASFVEGRDCSGPSHTIQAPIDVLVVP